MGYTTDFKGSFLLNKELDESTFLFLQQLNKTRRMKRNVDAQYGIDGEFYVFEAGDYDSNIVDINQSPKSQPGLWCQWVPTDDRLHIEWDGGEKFYNYVEWIEYIISKVLAPRGYILNGIVRWRGECFGDDGSIIIVDNTVNGKRLITDYSINKLLGENIIKKNISPIVKKNISPIVKKKKTDKEKHKEEIDKLQKEISDLENKLKKAEKIKNSPETKRVGKRSVQEIMLEKIKNSCEFGGSLEDFKDFMISLLKDK